MMQIGNGSIIICKNLKEFRPYTCLQYLKIDWASSLSYQILNYNKLNFYSIVKDFLWADTHFPPMKRDIFI